MESVAGEKPVGKEGVVKRRRNLGRGPRLWAKVDSGKPPLCAELSCRWSVTSSTGAHFQDGFRAMLRAS